jgi:hypothetical protein
MHYFFYGMGSSRSYFRVVDDSNGTNDLGPCLLHGKNSDPFPDHGRMIHLVFKTDT